MILVLMRCTVSTGIAHHWNSPARSSNLVNESAILAEDVQSVDLEDEQAVPVENEETEGIQKVFLPVISN